MDANECIFSVSYSDDVFVYLTLPLNCAVVIQRSEKSEEKKKPERISMFSRSLLIPQLHGIIK